MGRPRFATLYGFFADLFLPAGGRTAAPGLLITWPLGSRTLSTLYVCVTSVPRPLQSLHVDNFRVHKNYALFRGDNLKQYERAIILVRIGRQQRGAHLKVHLCKTAPNGGTHNRDLAGR